MPCSSASSGIEWYQVGVSIGLVKSLLLSCRLFFVVVVVVLTEFDILSGTDLPNKSDLYVWFQ